MIHQKRYAYLASLSFSATRRSPYVKALADQKAALFFTLLFTCSTAIKAQQPVFTFPLVEPYDVSSFAYAGVDERFSVITEETSATSLVFSTDGTKLFVTGSDGADAIVEYHLSVPYDVSTSVHAGADEEFSVADQESNPLGLAFNNDGTKMFVLGTTGDAIVAYNLSTAYDVSTSVYAGEAEEFFVGDQESIPLSLSFNDDGTRMFVIGFVAGANDAIVEYQLPTPFDVSTSIYAGETEEFLVSDEESNPTDLTFNNDGTRMFVIGIDDDAIVAYHLSTPYDISTAVYAGEAEEFFVGNEESTPYDLVFNDDGTRMFILGVEENAIIEYQLAYLVDYPENETGSVIDIEANDGQGGANDQSVTYTLEGPDASLFNISSSGIITFNASPDFEEPSDADLNNTYLLTVVIENSISSSRQNINISIQDIPDVAVFTSVGTGFDISTSVYAGVDKEFAVANQEFPFDLAFNNDGTRMFVINGEANVVEEYHLLAPYDVSTSVFAGVDEEFFVGDEEISPLGIAFNNTGTRMYIIGTIQDAVIEYHLGTAFDVSTSVYAGADEAFVINNQERDPTGLTFNNDGSKLFVIGTNGDAVIEYHLSIAFDVSTAIYAGADEEFFIGNEENTPLDLAFNNDGTRMFVLGRNGAAVVAYRLPTPYDVSTSIYAGISEEFSVAAEELIPHGLAFNKDGTSMYVLGINDDAIVTYQLASIVDYQENKTVAVIDIEANDGKGGANDASVTYSLTGTDASLFRINASGVITFNTSPDFEDPRDNDSDNKYTIAVQAADVDGFETTQEIIVTVLDEDEISPIITSATTVDFMENSAGVVYTAIANEPVTFSLGNTRDERLFGIANENEIRFLNTPDFEQPADANRNNEYLLDVIATDVAGNRTVLTVTITIIDIDDTAPVFTSSNRVLYIENTSSAAYIITANEPATFSLSDTKDGPLFELVNANEVFFLSTPDFENPQDADENNEYLLDVTATDIVGNNATLTVTITISDVDDTAPVFTSGNATFYAENRNNAAYVITADEPAAFTLGSAKDGPLFELVNENEVFFLSPPDFENPEDADLDNEYLLDLVAIDPAGNSTMLEVSITVTEADLIAPTFTSQLSVSFEENSEEVAYRVTVDEQATFALGTDLDEALFTLTNENEIRFISAPDFENPEDVDFDNSYQLLLKATDLALNESSQEILIIVVDLDDNPLSVQTQADDAFTLYPNPVKEMLYIKSPEDERIQEISIYNTLGQFVKHFENHLQSMDLSLLPPGGYFLIIRSQSSYYMLRFIKE